MLANCFCCAALCDFRRIPSCLRLTQGLFPDAQLSSGLESWSSTDTEGELICGEALILADVAASSHDSASGAPANAPDMATWMHHAPAPRAWAVHHSMVADAHMSAAHREPVLSVPYGAPAFGVLTVPTYAPAYSFHNYDSVMGSLVVDPLDKQLGSKRLFPVEFLHHDFAYDSFSPRPKSARISSKRTQDLLRIEAAAVASASAAAAVPSIPHVPTPASVAVLEQARPLVCQPAANRASQHQPGGKTTILQCCKFTSKQTQAACKGQLTIVLHKRGHLAVSCSSRHQWVWCSMCCNCVTGVKSTNGRQRGCSVPTHWYVFIRIYPIYIYSTVCVHLCLYIYIYIYIYIILDKL